MILFVDALAALEQRGPVKRQGHNWRATCPAHEDRNPSLDLAEGDDGRALFTCRSVGCGFEQIVAALGLDDTRRDGGLGEPIIVYTYRDEQGEPLFEVGRFAGKRFLQRRAGADTWKGGIGDTRRVLYGLPALLRALEARQTIYVVEGEKDVLRLVQAGHAATCNPMGAGKWRPEYAAMLTGADVVVIADRDKAGYEHARHVARQLEPVAASVTLRQPAVDQKGADVSDHLDAGLGLDELLALEDAGADRMRITSIADVRAKRITWLEDGLVARGMLTGLVAPGGTVKGLYGIHLAAKIAERGERTLFLCSEDALDYIVRPRFDAAGCDGRLAFALAIEGPAGTRPLLFPSDLPALEAAIAKVDPRLVIIDPVASYIEPGLDMAKNNQMRGILQPLITLAAHAGVAIVPVYHLGKNRDRGAIGSVAFEDACRAVLTAARDDDDEDVRHLELTKSNIGPTGYGRKLRVVEVPLEIDGETVGVAKLVDEGRSGKSVHALLARKEPSGPEPEKRELARAALAEALVDAGTDGCNADAVKRQVAEAVGVSPSTVWRAFGELKKDELALAVAERDEHGSILEWKWVAKAQLLLGRDDA